MNSTKLVYNFNIIEQSIRIILYLSSASPGKTRTAIPPPKDAEASVSVVTETGLPPRYDRHMAEGTGCWRR